MILQQYYLIPKGPLETEVEIMWLVHKDAKKGVDYNVDKITWMWHETTLEDKKIIENNQKWCNVKKIYSWTFITNGSRVRKT